MGLKGVAASLVLAAIFGAMLGVMFLPLIFSLTFRYHVRATVTLTYETSDAESALLTLLYHQKIYRILAERELEGTYEYYDSSKAEFESELNSLLKSITLSNFSISDDDEITSYGSFEDYSQASTFVAKPYNPKKLLKRIDLMVGK
jgi:hypothetical protein